MHVVNHCKVEKKGPRSPSAITKERDVTRDGNEITTKK